MTDRSDGLSPSFRPLTIGALYPGLARGLHADVLATQALGGQAYPICTSHVVAGRGVVTDVLNVPTDTVSAQLEHVFETEAPTAAKIGIVGASPTVDVLFRHLENLSGPVILDLTLSGPSGEDIVEQTGLEKLVEHLSTPHLVAVRLTDAALLAGMEIPSLDDAQVAVQRIAQQGAENVLLRCGRLPTHFFDMEKEPPNYAVDLFYDGEDMALFEAPYLAGLEGLSGLSSGLLMPVLDDLQAGTSLEEALQEAKGRVTEALRNAQTAVQGTNDPANLSTFFDALKKTGSVRLPSGDGQ